MTQTICVAELYIEITYADEDFFAPRLLPYVCKPVEHPDLRIQTILCDELSEPEGELISQDKSSYTVRTEHGLCRYIKGIESKNIPAIVYYAEDYSEAKIYLQRNVNRQGVTTTTFEYMYTGWLFQNRLCMLRGVVLHSSAVNYRGECVCFSADSGVGKSTHASLWKKVFGDEVQILNDDKPALYWRGGTCMVQGTPWSGKGELHLNECAPLQAIVFLERAEHNEIEEMSLEEAVMNLVRQMYNPFWDEEIGQASMEFVGQIYETHIPVFCLKCNVSEEAVRVVHKRIFGGMDL